MNQESPKIKLWVFKAPWFYVTWKPPVMPPEYEMALARMTRREGLLYMLAGFLAIVTNDGRYTFGCLRMFVNQNYTSLLCLVGYYTGLVFSETNLQGASMWIGGVWLVTMVLGSARYLGWLTALMHRWPPMAKN